MQYKCAIRRGGQAATMLNRYSSARTIKNKEGIAHHDLLR